MLTSLAVFAVILCIILAASLLTAAMDAKYMPRTIENHEKEKTP